MIWSYLVIMGLGALGLCCDRCRPWAACALIVAAGVLTPFVMGTPRPAWVQESGEYEVLSLNVPDDETMYIWVAGPPPRALALPFDLEIISELKRGLREARSNGSMRGPSIVLGTRSDDGITVVHRPLVADPGVKVAPRRIRPTPLHDEGGAP